MKRRSVIKRDLPQIEVAVKTRRKETTATIDISGTKKKTESPVNVAPAMEITKRIVETPRIFHRKVSPIVSTSATVATSTLANARKSTGNVSTKTVGVNVLNKSRQMPNKNIEVANNRGNKAVDQNTSKGRPSNRRETAPAVEVPAKKQLPGKVKVENAGISILRTKQPTKAPEVANEQVIIRNQTTIVKKNMRQCLYCNLRFASDAWLSKHIENAHKDVAEIELIDEDDPLILQCAEQREVECVNKLSSGLRKENALDKIIAGNSNQNQNKPSTASHEIIQTMLTRIKSKSSPSKQALREQLKKQLKVQQDLLRVQQEIFIKANQAQNDILSLIAELDSDDAEDEDVDVDDEPKGKTGDVANKNNFSDLTTALNDFNTEVTKVEEADQPWYEYAATDLPTEEVLPNNDAEDENVFVVVQTEEGEEEFELFEVVEGEYDTKPEITNTNYGYSELENAQPEQLDDGNICFEVVTSDGGDVNCRIIDKEQRAPAAKKPKCLNKNASSAPKRTRMARKGGSKKVSEVITSQVENLEYMNDTEIAEYIQGLVQKVEPNGENKFACPLCDETFTNRYSIGPHVQRVHCKQKSKQCPHCDRAFTCTGDLTRHIRIHTGDKPFKCSFQNCSYAFRASGDLHKHMRRHNETNPEELRKHICPTCDRAFERMYDLKRHQLTHTVHSGEDFEGYQCEHCPKKFVRKDQYKSHILRHMGLQPYECPKCNRAFSDYANCLKHINSKACKNITFKTNSNLFQCHYCAKRLTTKIGIKTHVEKCWSFAKVPLD